MFIKHLLAITEQGTKKNPSQSLRKSLCISSIFKVCWGSAVFFLPKRQLRGLGLGWALEVPWGKGVDFFFFFSLHKQSNMLGPNAVTFKFHPLEGKIISSVAANRELGALGAESESESVSHSVMSMSPMDCSPPGFSVHGILQARIPEWVAMPSSRADLRLQNSTLDQALRSTGGAGV